METKILKSNNFLTNFQSKDDLFYQFKESLNNLEKWLNGYVFSYFFHNGKKESKYFYISEDKYRKLRNALGKELVLFNLSITDEYEEYPPDYFSELRKRNNIPLNIMKDLKIFSKTQQKTGYSVWCEILKINNILIDDPSLIAYTENRDGKEKKYFLIAQY